MIIQIRGTSGSGKTTVMRKVMEKLGKWSPQFVEGRRKPLYYRNHRGVIVLGHYEVDCGGCDTIGSAPQVFGLVQSLEFTHALTEGLLWSEDVKWTLQLKQEVRAVFLITSPEQCMKWIKKRQDGREPKDIDRVWRNMSKRVGVIERARQRLVPAGIRCVRLHPNQSPKVILKWLNMKS